MTSRTERLLLAVTVAIALGACSLLGRRYDPMTSYGWAEELTAVDAYTIYDMDWSPDGDEIAMVGYHGTVGQDVLIYDISSQTVRSLLGEEDAFLANRVSWSPDGEYLAVNGGYWTDESAGGIWLVPVNGAPPTFLADGVDTAWSPNGDRIAIAENVPSTSQLKILDVGSGEETLLLEVPQDRTVAGIHPEWSPTSELIAFTVDELTSDGQYSISVAYLFDLSRPVPRRMFPVTEVYARDLSWVPDGKWLVVMARTSTGGGVYLAPSEGECIRRLLPDEFAGSYVDVSSEGDRLVLNRGGTAFLVDLRAAAAEGVIQYPLSCP